MDEQQFDRVAQIVAAAQTRRGALRLLLAAAVGAGVPVLAATDGAAKKKKGKRNKGGGTGGGGTGGGSGGTGGGGSTGGGAAPNYECPMRSPFCDASVVCGRGNNGLECSCESTQEGSNACIAFIESCSSFALCTNTQDCRDALGPNYFCQEDKINRAGQPCGCGGRCLPGCDKPSA